jgi:threonyl-tRNA synthetase
LSVAQAQEQVTLRLPDGGQLAFDQAPTGFEVAERIGKKLAKDALAIKADGEVRDLARPIDWNADIEIVTRDHPDALELIRHDAAHVMAEATQELYPDTQVTFGPPTETGFYYDFARDEPFTPEDLKKIEDRMHEIVDRDETVIREVWDRHQAIDYFKNIGEHYKAQHIQTLPEDTEIRIYRQGDWLDLCKGPHLPSTGKLGHAFKLLKVSGAYWRGDQNNEQLQRVYGTAFETDKRLKDYLHMLEEAERRDHRRLGKELGLFHQQEEAAGSVFWHPKGWTLYRVIERFVRDAQEARDYVEVKTPQLIDRSLWERSGHWEKFHHNMFTAETEDDRTWAVKPMNCPGHVQIFKAGITSYRDLPYRMAEFGSCHRYEPSGALHGLMRVRAFTQDDAHIFCTEEQINAETKRFCDMLQTVYSAFGFDDVSVKFSDRPDNRAGSDEVWDKAEAALKDAAESTELPYTYNPGEGAFYGPKLEFVLHDALGRDWQCGTLQVDFVLPERLDANYVGEDGEKHRPVMLHRAILGSFERFIAILIEEYAGRFPVWLSPVQVVVATITDAARDYAERVAERMTAAGIRVETDLRNEKINYKVREHSNQKVPVIAVVGEREAEQDTVALRRLGQKQQEVLALDDAVTKLGDEATPPRVA